jgi:hypothetical protein
MESKGLHTLWETCVNWNRSSFTRLGWGKAEAENTGVGSAGKLHQEGLGSKHWSSYSLPPPKWGFHCRGRSGFSGSWDWEKLNRTVKDL